MTGLRRINTSELLGDDMCRIITINSVLESKPSMYGSISSFEVELENGENIIWVHDRPTPLPIRNAAINRWLPSKFELSGKLHTTADGESFIRLNAKNLTGPPKDYTRY